MYELNMFPLRHFGSNVDRISGKRLGQLTTRLYIFLLTVSLVILVFYNIIRPKQLTETFIRPTIHTYHRLIADHGDTLQCPCSSISSMYDQYVKVDAVYHQVGKQKTGTELSFDDTE